MKNPVFLIFIITAILSSCKDGRTGNQLKKTDTPEKEIKSINEKNNLKSDNNKQLLITENSFLRFTIGDSVNLESKNLNKIVQQTGGGSFTSYSILDENGKEIGTILPKFNDDKIIGTIEVTSKEYKTKEGIAIGSTYQDLKRHFPNLKTHGSEIESRTTSNAGGLSFLLDAYFNAYQIDESKIKPSTEIKKISIKGTVN
ncbi:hypothetical protein NQT66_19615 [Cellulophaga baltica]|uniref:hypothetical protein n=1 Tax=Cellulophaga baltica TaxID=76594 RepID=UPI0021473A8F|nr:hypothetical protein [Cellulophaga baltica]MCR1027034.1 hypothetical protein [Cellulophaga baltica]